jgi:hypothetical protein
MSQLLMIYSGFPIHEHVALNRGVIKDWNIHSCIDTYNKSIKIQRNNCEIVDNLLFAGASTSHFTKITRENIVVQFFKHLQANVFVFVDTHSSYSNTNSIQYIAIVF